MPRADAGAASPADRRREYERVASSARDASTLGYRVVMVADANAANTDDELNATLHTVYRSFGDVRSADDVLAAIGGG